jgi:AraC-like DNA-binding protein
MVCIRCKMVVKAELEKLGLHYIVVELGEAEIMEDISAAQHDQFKAVLLKSGLELLDDKKSVLIQKIKNVIIELIHYSEQPLAINFSDHLSQKLNHNYTYLANLFSEVQGTTIEKFIIAHKIERVKELLVYNELNLTEIAYLMHYSSVAHLSAQFKKITGLTPSHFKQLREKRLTMLENL